MAGQNAGLGGTAVRPGQPKILTLRAQGGKVGIDGSFARGLFVPDRDIDSDRSTRRGRARRTPGRFRDVRRWSASTGSSAMAMQDERNFIVWGSAEVAGAGHVLLNYLAGSNIDR